MVHRQRVVVEPALQHHAVLAPRRFQADAFVELVLLHRFGVAQQRWTEPRAAAVLVGNDRACRQQVLRGRLDLALVR